MALTQVKKAGLDSLALDHVFTIGASGSSAYTFQGEGLNGTVNNPTLYLTRGKTYRFENGSGGHPIRIQSTSGASGTAYNTGVTNNAGSGTVIVEVQHDAPDVLYYQCTSHAAMNGILYITGALADGGVTTAKLADDAVTSAKLADSSVQTAAIQNNAVNVNKIADNAVTTDKIINNAVNVNKIANNAVTSAKILNNNVTTDKIADQAVTLAKLPHGTSSNDGKFLRANNGADPSFETVSIPAGTTINTNASNRVITGSGAANTLNGEENLTFDGTSLTISNVSPTLVFTDSNQDSDYNIHVNGGNFNIHDVTNNANRVIVDSTGRTHFGAGSLNSANTVSIVPADGRISYGMDGRDAFVTGESGAYIYSGSGVGGTMPAGDLILQSRSNQNRTIRFVTGSTPAQRMSIDSGGLKFGTDTSDDNALDDYEEGSWTATCASGGSSFTNDSNNNRYVKIGSMVYITGEVYGLSNPNNNTFEVGGLPYQIAQSREGTGSIMTHHVTYGSGRTMATIYIYASQTKFRIYTSGNATSWRAITGSDFTVSGDVIFSFAYHTV